MSKARSDSLKVRNMLVKVSIVFLFSILIWRVIFHFNDLYSIGGYSSMIHFFTALGIAILSFVLIEIMRRIDKVSWKQIGMSNIRTNISSFLIGTILWLIPAFIGLVISLLAGWVEITVLSNINQILLSTIVLYVTVFLIEAFPEEIITRGYIYSYLNTLFPHWVTLILQTLLFTLFAFLVGAIYSIEQLLFIPGYGFMLGYFRSKSGNVWTSIGFHVSIMTASQILNPVHGNFDVNGVIAIRFFAFNLLPYVLGSFALEYIYPNHSWSEINPFKK